MICTCMHTLVLENGFQEFRTRNSQTLNLSTQEDQSLNITPIYPFCTIKSFYRIKSRIFGRKGVVKKICVKKRSEQQHSHVGHEFIKKILKRTKGSNFRLLLSPICLIIYDRMRMPKLSQRRRQSQTLPNCFQHVFLHE
jgi:hypothetical protein